MQRVEKVFILLLGFTFNSGGCQHLKAQCLISAGSGASNVSGSIYMEQLDGSLKLNVSLSGFPNASQLYGFHVHTNPEISNLCADAGSHYNPKSEIHGAPSDPITRRHLGDLRNLQVNNGVVNVVKQYNITSLLGQFSILNRSLIVHLQKDDLGRGNNIDSNTTGNSGPRIGCCTIEQLVSITYQGYSTSSDINSTSNFTMLYTTTSESHEIKFLFISTFLPTLYLYI